MNIIRAIGKGLLTSIDNAMQYNTRNSSIRLIDIKETDFIKFIEDNNNYR